MALTLYVLGFADLLVDLVDPELCEILHEAVAIFAGKRAKKVFMSPHDFRIQPFIFAGIFVHTLLDGVAAHVRAADEKVLK